MKLKVALNSKSINALISQLNEIKTTILPNMIEYFLTRCCEEIKIKANKNLETSGLGADVISEIQGQWSISVKGKKALLRNGEGRGYTVDFCWLSILNTAVCTCQSQTPNLSLPFW